MKKQSFVIGGENVNVVVFHFSPLLFHDFFAPINIFFQKKYLSKQKSRNAEGLKDQKWFQQFDIWSLKLQIQ